MIPANRKLVEKRTAKVAGTLRRMRDVLERADDLIETLPSLTQEQRQDLLMRFENTDAAYEVAHTLLREAIDATEPIEEE